MMIRKIFTLLLLCFLYPSLHFAQQLIPVRSLPGLLSVQVVEVTNSYYNRSFAPNSAEITTRLPDPLGSANRDYVGTPWEYYDVYYSNADGTYNIDGAYVTVDCKFDQNFAGGAHNTAEVKLDFGTSIETANILTHFVVNGTNYLPGTEVRVADGDPMTFTTLGNTYNMPTTFRLSVTVGFPSTIVSTPPCDQFPCINGNYMLCHYPPGNLANPQTLCIPLTAIAAHLSAHPNDVCGPCVARIGNNRSHSYKQSSDAWLPSVQVFPQPAADVVTFNVQSPLNGRLSLRLMDASGQDLGLLKEWDAEAGEIYEIPADLSDLPSGLYLYSLTGADFRLPPGKVIVTR